MKLATFVLLALNAAALPLHFEPNRGQVKGRTEWTAGVGGAHVFLAGSEAKFGDVHMRMVGARRIGKLEGLEPTGGYSSYFVGRDEKSWVTSVPHFARVRQRSVYPGIDVVFYASDRNVEYDFLVAAGANPKHIELAFDKPVRVDANGDLVLAGGVRQHRPRVFQDGREITAEYRVTSQQRVQIALADYDHSRPLTIDPVVEFATYLGGPGADYFSPALFDAAGNIILYGTTETPATPSLDPFQQPSIVSYQAAVMKMTPDAKRVIFFFVLGGGTGAGIASAPDGGLILTGKALDSKFPVKNAYQTEYRAAFGTGFFAKVSADARSLIYSSYLGGSNQDSTGSVMVDPAGNAFIIGQTGSADYPIKNALQATFGGGLDCTVTKLSPSGAVLFTTFLGGTALDGCGSLKLKVDGSLFFTAGAGLARVYGPEPTSNIVFATMDPEGRSVKFKGFPGGEDFVGAVERMVLDKRGNIYIKGRAFNSFLPLKNAFQTTWFSDLTGFFIKLDPGANNIIYSSFWGGPSGVFAGSMAVDSNESIYLYGTAFGDDLPLKDSIQPWRGGGPLYQQDAFLAKFAPSGQSLIYSTYLGGNGSELANGILLDGDGNAYLGGQTSSTDFPTKNPFQAKYGGGAGDGYLLKLVDQSTPASSPVRTSPARLTFRFVQGGPNPEPQSVAATGEAYFLTTSPLWIAATPAGSPVPPNSVRVTVNPSGFSPGQYAGSVVLHPQSGAEVSTVDVVLIVQAAAPVITSVEPGLVQVGSDDTVVTVRGSGFVAGASLYVDGIPWTFSPVNVVDSKTLTFTMPRLYLSGITAHPIAVVNPQSPQSNSVSLSVGQLGPTIANGGIVNAASYATGPVAVGEIVVIYGTNFGDPAKIRVLFDTFPTTLIYATPTQIAATVPRTVANRQTTLVVIQSGDVFSSPVTLNVTAAAPALFTADSTGTGQASALNQDYGINGATNPAERGSVIQLFGTGGGLLTREALPQVTLPISATIDGIDSLVQFAGAAPGLPEGVLQVNLFIPAGARVGSVPVVVKIGDATSNVATVAIK